MLEYILEANKIEMYVKKRQITMVKKGQLSTLPGCLQNIWTSVIRKISTQENPKG